MDMLLQRVYSGPEGVFSTLSPLGKPPFAVALEHSYEAAEGWIAKVPRGTYQCLRGEHQLASGPPFTTYEVQVPGHTGILFHKGNIENDSEGCILLGLQFGNLSGLPAVLQSTSAFIFFLSRQVNDSFNLTVGG